MCPFADTLPALHARVPSAAGRLLTALRTHALTLCSRPGGGLPNRTGLHSSGLERGHAHPSQRMSLETSSAAGNAEPPMLATSARSRRTLLTCPLRLAPCCSRKLDRTLPEHLRSCRRRRMLSFPLRTSVYFAPAAPTLSSCPQLGPGSVGAALEWPHLRRGGARSRCHFPRTSPPNGARCCWHARAPGRRSLAGGSSTQPPTCPGLRASYKG